MNIVLPPKLAKISFYLSKEYISGYIFKLTFLRSTTTLSLLPFYIIKAGDVTADRCPRGTFLITLCSRKGLVILSKALRSLLERPKGTYFKPLKSFLLTKSIGILILLLN